MERYGLGHLILSSGCMQPTQVVHRNSVLWIIELLYPFHHAEDWAPEYPPWT